MKIVGQTHSGVMVEGDNNELCCKLLENVGKAQYRGLNSNSPERNVPCYIMITDINPKKIVGQVHFGLLTTRFLSSFIWSIFYDDEDTKTV